MITPEPQTLGGVPHRCAQARLINALATTADRVSEVVDARGYTKLILAIQFAGMAGATDLVGSLEVLGGGPQAAAIADLAPLGLAAANAMGVLPLGFTIDAEADAYAIAATFVSNAPILLCFDKVPPKFATRLVFGSGGIGATLTVDAYLL